jgi:hypothetical protein
MEYVPSYMDDLYLMHHGIKGQKWGIRRFQNEDGSRTSLGKQHERNSVSGVISRNDAGTSNLKRLRNAGAIGSSDRVRRKQQMLDNKIAKTGDKNVILRTQLNDRRRGRIAQLKTKAEHREAKERYLQNKSDENRQALREARLDRIAKNGLNPFSARQRGAYNRYRASGKSVAQSVLNTAGNTYLTNAARAVTAGAASAAISRAMLMTLA